MPIRQFVAIAIAMIALASAAEARRVALVIGQSAYPGSKDTPATVGLSKLDNPGRDARRMAKLLKDHGFELVACDAKGPGCFDLDRAKFLAALARLEQRAAGADLALVFFAGHGLASDEGNILAPVDAKVDCATGAVTNAVLVERMMGATVPARMKLVILDACRDNPIRLACPNLIGKKLSFTRIEAGAMRDFLLVTSTQFGQQALDGPVGKHSPFATALFASLEANPNIYFEQVMNEVGKATHEAADELEKGFLQMPGKVVGLAAPVDCLAGKGCIGDQRMAAMAVENERLAADAAGVRNVLEAEEKARGRRYTMDERGKRVAELEKTLASIGASTDPLRQEAKRLIGEGNVAGGQAKLDQALDADEKAIAEAERVAAEKRRAAARSARDLAVLAWGADVVRAMAYYKRATKLDPEDAQTWDDYGRAALAAGYTDQAKAALEHAAAKSHESNDPGRQYWATLGLGDVALMQGRLTDAQRHYEGAATIAERLAKANRKKADWQRNLSVSHERIGDVLVRQGRFQTAFSMYERAHTIRERLANVDPANADWQRDLSVSHERIGDVLMRKGDLSAALASYRTAHAIRDRLAREDPKNADWQRDLSVSHGKIGDVLVQQDSLAAALASYRAVNAIGELLAKTDRGNADWQRDLSVSHERIGDVLLRQGDLSGALASYRNAHAIRERLVELDRGNADWQRDLSVSYERIGDVLARQGDVSGALRSHQSAHTIRKYLANSDPDNARWQRDLSSSYAKMSKVLLAADDRTAALTNAQKALAIAETLAESIEQAETRDLGKPGTATAAQLGSAAWRAIFAHDFAKSLMLSERAHALVPDLAWLDANRAHALLLLGRTQQAKAVYMARKGRMSLGKTWERAIAEDFRALREAGLGHPMMAQIETVLGVAR